MFLLLLFFISCMISLEAQQGIEFHYRSSYSQTRYKQSEKEIREKRITQAVLGNFANIVANILNIMQDPENRENVTIQSSLMVGNIVNMVVQATKQTKATVTEDEIATYIQSLDDSFKEELVAIILKQRKNNGLIK